MRELRTSGTPPRGDNPPLGTGARRGLSLRIEPTEVGLDESIQQVVLPLSVDSSSIARSPLEPKTEPLEDGGGGQVRSNDSGFDSVESKCPKRDFANARGGLGSVALPPERTAKPVLDSGSLVRGAKLVQPDSSDVGATVHTANREVETVPRTKRVASHSHKGTTELGSVGVANRNRPPYFLTPKQPDEIGHIAIYRKSEDEATSLEGQFEAREGGDTRVHRTLRADLSALAFPHCDSVHLSRPLADLGEGAGEIDGFRRKRSDHC